MDATNCSTKSVLTDQELLKQDLELRQALLAAGIPGKDINHLAKILRPICNAVTKKDLSDWQGIIQKELRDPQTGLLADIREMGDSLKASLARKSRRQLTAAIIGCNLRIPVPSTG